MSSKFLLLAAFVLPIVMCAQQPMSPTQGGAQVAQPAANVVVPGTSIYVVGGGLYGTGVYIVPQGGSAAGGASVAPASNAGISMMGTAGISLNTPVNLGVQSTLFPQNPVAYSNYYGGRFVGGAAGYGGTAATTTETGTETGRLINDMGPSYPESAVASPEPTPSLGELAAQLKSAPPHSVHMYTNEDARRISSTVVIGTTTVANAGQPAPPNANAPPQQQEQEQTPPQTPPQNKEMTANQPPPPATTEPQSAESQEPPQPLTRLPATSSPLPMLGLMGLVGAGVGVWLHGRR